MALLFGTQDGVYRSSTRDLASAERVLDAGPTFEISAIDGHRVFAASKTGLYRSLDGGSMWNRLDVPQTEVYSIAVSPDGDRVYAGTHPAHVYVSSDDGETWSDLDGFQELPSRDRWHTPRHREASHVRSFGVHPDEPDRVVAGVEVGGVHVSEDRGQTWTERRSRLEFDREDDLQFDVHHLLVVDADEFVVSCGGGLYRTSNAGKHWTRLEPDPNRPYVSESFHHGKTLYTAAQTLPPTLPLGRGYDPTAVDAAIFESTDGGESFEKVPYPGGPEEFVTAWCEHDGRVLAGTTQGQVIGRSDEEWATIGFVPDWIRSMTAIPADHGSSTNHAD